ncbi:MAG: hypothetical protein ACR2P9_00665 [Gammaproteobacteria bacterium]
MKAKFTHQTGDRRTGRIVASVLFSLCVIALAWGAEGEFTIPGFGSIHPGELVPLEVSPQALEKDLRSLEEAVSPAAPLVSVQDGKVTYVGDISAAGFDALAALPSQETISVLAIDSLGGEIYWGMKIGELVFANGWDVHVTGHCYSACANYVFPAGKRKVLLANSVVGWHGSARQQEALAEAAGISLEEQFMREIVPAMLDGFTRGGLSSPPRELLLPELAQEFGRLNARRLMEEEFFQRIGVDAESAVYGLRSGSPLSTGAGGWTYRIADMAKFGITNVQWQGQGEYPPPGKLAFLGLTVLEVTR